MMIIRTIVLVLSIMLECGILFAQTNLTVVMNDGEEQSHELLTSSRMTFVGDTLVVNMGMESDTTTMFLLDDVRRLFFTDTVLTQASNEEKKDILVYPNPVRDILMIDGIQEECTLSVFSMIGTEMLRKQYKSGDYIDVSGLKSGIYIVRVGKCVSKFTKK